MAEGFYYGGEQDTIRITTQAGFQIEGTVDHPIRRATGEWAMLADLVIGDAVKIEPVVFTDAYLDVPFNAWAVRGRRDADHDAPGLPRVKITEEWGAFLGYLLGDGSIQKNAIRVTCDKQDADVIEHVMATLGTLGLTPSLKQHHPRYGGQDVTVSSARLNDFVWRLGIEREKRRFLAVPAAILRSPKPVVREFLRTLFESDGTVDLTNSRVAFTSKSHRLAREVQLLLTGFGVFSSIRAAFNKVYQQTYYTVYLRRAGVDAFAASVGFVGKRKSERLAAIVAKPHSNRYRDEKWADVVVKIERGKGDVFDVTVPGPAEFGSGGFVSHNTPIKSWEYALSGAAVVASPTVYGRCIEDAVNGYVCRDADQWEESLSFLVEGEELRRNLAARLKRDVLEKWSLRKNYRRWPNAWRRLIEEGQGAGACGR